jgi:hypothetical protein
MHIKILHERSEDMARDGILLLTFSLILLAVKQVSETPILPPFIPPPPACFFTALRIILITISLIFMITVFWIWRKGLLKKAIFLIIFFLLLSFVLWLIPPIPAMPVCFFTAIGIIALLASLAFMVAVFWRRLADKILKNFLKDRFIYWMIFWFVYTIGWLKGLLSVPAESFAFPLVFYIGFVWFLVIGIVTLKAASQRRR